MGRVRRGGEHDQPQQHPNGKRPTKRDKGEEEARARILATQFSQEPLTAQALFLLHHMKPSFFFNYFKHVPEDLVISSTPGVVISVLGTLLMASLFFMQLMSYMELRTKTELVVDDLLDEMLRVNFNVTLPSAPCDYLSVDVSDFAGGARHNITKDILKWRLNSHGELLGSSLAVSVVDTPGAGKERHSNHAEDEAAFDVELDDDYEPPDANLSQPLTEATFNEFLGAHELTVVLLRPLVHLVPPARAGLPRRGVESAEPALSATRDSRRSTASPAELLREELGPRLPDAPNVQGVRLLPPRCADAAACPHSRAPAPSPRPPPPRPRPRPRPPRRPAPNPLLHRSQPPLAPQGDGSHFEAFTGARTTEALLEFVQAQMKDYQSSHPALAAAKRSARFTVHHGALTEGSDLYRAKMDVAEAQAFCGNNPSCVGFTWHGDKKAYEKEKPMVYFKGQGTTLNNDVAWTTYTKQANATVGHSASGSLYNGPEGCRVAGHLMVRKVPGTLKLLLHSEEHDHEDGLINSSHRVDEFWCGVRDSHRGCVPRPTPSSYTSSPRAPPRFVRRYGEPLTPHQRRVMLTSDRELLDGVTSHRIEGQLFLSQAAGHAYVHYLKVVTMEIMHNVYSGAARDHRTIAYKYTVHTNKFSAETGGAGTRPSIDFRYDLSPISIVVSEDPMPMYQFLTSTCAIVGGVFTVIGLLENIIHHTSKQLMKKKI